MKKILLSITLCLCCWTGWASTPLNPVLQVSEFQLDDDTANDPKQLVIRFNQPIAMAGEIPSEQQINAIKLSGEGLSCAWRFVREDSLACEIQSPLAPMSDYAVVVSEQFTGHQQQRLSKAVEWTFITAMPNIDFHHEYQLDSFPGKAWLRITTRYAVELDKLQGRLVAEHMSGQQFTLGLKPGESYFRRKVSEVLPIENAPAGEYQIKLLAGSRLTPFSNPLAEDLNLTKLTQYDASRWLGFSCRQASEFRTVQLNNEGLVDCPVNSLWLSFTRPVASLFEGNQTQWLVNEENEAQTLGRISSDSAVHYQFDLMPAHEYQLGLQGMTDYDGGLFEGPETLAFRTAEAEPFVRIYPRDAVTEADAPNWPQVWQSGYQDLVLQQRWIDTPEQLQQMLQQHPEPTQWFETSTSARLVDTRTLSDLEPDVGDQHSGWLLSGLRTPDDKNFFGGARLNVAAFNLSVYTGNRWLIATHDWHNASPVPAEVSLICADSSTQLGQVDSQGLLEIPAPNLPLRQTCYLWAQHDNQRAIQALPVSYPWQNKQEDKEKPLATGWTSQPVYEPGETVSIGFWIRQFNDHQWQEVDTDAEWRLTVGKEGRQLHNQAVSVLSRYALGEVAFTLADNVESGYYSIFLHKGKYQREIGYLNVQEYIAPEFSFEPAEPVFVADLAHIPDQPFVLLQANGQPLQQAKVTVESWMFASDAPDPWPQKYDYYFTHGEDQMLVTSEVVSTPQPGGFLIRSSADEASLPFAQMVHVITVTSEAGETQQYQIERGISGSKIVPGLFIHSGEQHSMELALFNREMQPVAAPPHSQITVSTTQFGRKISLIECPLEDAVTQCVLPAPLPDSVDVTLQLADRVLFRQSVWLEQRVSHDKPLWILRDSDSQESTSWRPVSYQQGHRLNLTLVSPLAGQALLLMETADSLLTRHLTVEQGENHLQIDLTDKMIPQMNISASMLLTREIANRHQWPRRLVDSLTVNVQPQAAELDVQLQTQQTVFKPGQSASLKLSAGQDTDVQLWLVNESLYQLMGEDNLDPESGLWRMLLNQGYSTAGQWLDLANDIYQPTLMQEFTELKGLVNQFSGAVQRNRVPPPGQASSIAADKFGEVELLEVSGLRRTSEFDGAMSQTLFQQSQWLGTFHIKAHKQREVSVTMPMILSSWRVMAIAVNEQRSRHLSEVLQTAQDMEYVLRAPKLLREGDQAKLNISFTNHASHPVHDKYILRNGDKIIATLELTSQPGQRSYQLALPTLVIGKHRLTLSSESNSAFISQADVEVVSAHVDTYQRWLLSNEDPAAIRMSRAALAPSLQLSWSDAEQDAPDWQAEIHYNQQYLHECWEQIVSRALAYWFNPFANQYWPEGAAHLQELIRQQSTFLQNGRLAYFAEQGADDWLTAYSLLAHQWLSEKQVVLLQNEELVVQQVSNIALNPQSSARARSMAMLALAARNDRVSLVIPTTPMKQDDLPLLSRLHLMLANRWLGEKSDLQYQQMQAWLDSGYQDVSTSRFESNLQRCFALQVMDPQSKHYQHILTSLLKSQASEGHFGHTTANAICAVALQGKTQRAQFQSVSIDEVIERGPQQQVNFERPIQGSYWITAQFQQQQAQLIEQQNGLRIQRQMYRKTGNEWLLLGEQDRVSIGDVLQVCLTLHTPVNREHVALTDYVPAGWVAMNPRFNQPASGRTFAPLTSMRIQDGRVMFYPFSLSAGEHEFRYQVEVRFAGHYLQPGAQAEAMYQPQVNGQTSASWQTIF